MYKITPEVGMGITECVGSDRYPGTIVKVSESGKTFWYIQDQFKPGPGHNYFGAQKWDITPTSNPTSIPIEYCRRAFFSKKYQRYVASGRGGGAIGVGVRSAYQDPHF